MLNWRAQSVFVISGCSMRGKNEIELTARVWREVLDRAWGGVASEELGEEMGKNRK